MQDMFHVNNVLASADSNLGNRVNNLLHLEIFEMNSMFKILPRTWNRLLNVQYLSIAVQFPRPTHNFVTSSRVFNESWTIFGYLLH